MLKYKYYSTIQNIKYLYNFNLNKYPKAIIIILKIFKLTLIFNF